MFAPWLLAALVDVCRLPACGLQSLHRTLTQRSAIDGTGLALAAQVFEKAGINVSVVYGQMPPEAYRAATGEGAKSDAYIPFFAAGISSVMHPWNPKAPTVHFNYRYFETDAPEGVEGACCSLPHVACVRTCVGEWRCDAVATHHPTSRQNTVLCCSLTLRVCAVHERVALCLRWAAHRRAARVVVRRRDGPDAVVRLRGGRETLPPDAQGRVRPARRRLLPALQAVVRRLLHDQGAPPLPRLSASPSELLASPSEL